MSSIILFAVVFPYIVFTVKLGEPYNHSIFIFLITCIYWLIVSTLFSENGKNANLLFVFIAMASLIPTVGSNTGLVKTISVLLPFLPFVCLNMRLDSRAKTDCFHVVLVCVLLFAPINKFYSFCGDSPGLFSKSTMITSGKLKYIRTTESRSVYLKEALHDIDLARRSNRSVLLYGECCEVFYYLSGLRQDLRQPVRLLNNKKQVDNIRLQIEKSAPVIFLLDSYPEWTTTSDSVLDAMIKTQHYKLKQGRGYRVWIPPALTIDNLNAVFQQ